MDQVRDSVGVFRHIVNNLSSQLSNIQVQSQAKDSDISSLKSKIGEIQNQAEQEKLRLERLIENQSQNIERLTEEVKKQDDARNKMIMRHTKEEHQNHQKQIQHENEISYQNKVISDCKHKLALSKAELVQLVSYKSQQHQKLNQDCLIIKGKQRQMNQFQDREKRIMSQNLEDFKEEITKEVHSKIGQIKEQCRFDNDRIINQVKSREQELKADKIKDQRAQSQINSLKEALTKESLQINQLRGKEKRELENQRVDFEIAMQVQKEKLNREYEERKKTEENKLQRLKQDMEGLLSSNSQLNQIIVNYESRIKEETFHAGQTREEQELIGDMTAQERVLFMDQLNQVKKERDLQLISLNEQHEATILLKEEEMSQMERELEQLQQQNKIQVIKLEQFQDFHVSQQRLIQDMKQKYNDEQQRLKESLSNSRQADSQANFQKMIITEQQHHQDLELGLKNEQDNRIIKEQQLQEETQRVEALEMQIQQMKEVYEEKTQTLIKMQHDKQLKELDILSTTDKLQQQEGQVDVCKMQLELFQQSEDQKKKQEEAMSRLRKSLEHIQTSQFNIDETLRISQLQD